MIEGWDWDDGGGANGVIKGAPLVWLKMIGMRIENRYLILKPYRECADGFDGEDGRLGPDAESE